MKTLKWIAFIIMFIPGLIIIGLAWLCHMLVRVFGKAEDGLFATLGWTVDLMPR